MIAALAVAASFARARWQLDFYDRARLEAWQSRRLAHFLRDVLPRAPRYRDLHATSLAQLPRTDKAAMMADFDGYNTRGVRYDEALAVAEAAERSRNFAPALGDVTVGLSSGTSGRRGIFLVSARERYRWAGILLARMLPHWVLPRLATPWASPIRVALFLRANSNLYTTIASRRIEFRYFDLTRGLDAAAVRLDAWRPDALVAPATVLRDLAHRTVRDGLKLRPQKVVSVAEVLEPPDRDAVYAAFGCATHQLYQATEGLLGYTCEQGTLHLNEAFTYVEPEWLDADKTRFHPTITDFSRETQAIARYRLDDVLRVADRPCACGRAERAIAAIEGRADEVLTLPSRRTGLPVAIYPDALRQALLLAGPAVNEYTVTQIDGAWEVALQPAPGCTFDACRDAVAPAIGSLCARYGVLEPPMRFVPWSAPTPGTKRKRIGAARSGDAACRS